MKRSLIALVVLAVFCFASIASAAAVNPFSDVPAKHWSYAAVNQLQKAGIVEGYGDGTFRGDRTMTRYEMAQVVANAMTKADKADAANKALIDKLATEFAAELKSLGARVAKLEKKTNVSITGDSRFRYMHNKPGIAGNTGLQGADKFDERLRLYFSGNVNDKTDVMVRMYIQGKPGDRQSGGGAGLSPGSDYLTRVDLAYFQVKDAFGFLDKVRIGRTNHDMFGYGIFGCLGNTDGITVWQKFGDVNFTGSVSSGNRTGADGKTVTTGQLGFKLSNNFNMRAGYYWADIPGTPNNAGGTGGTILALGPAGSSFKSQKGYMVGFDTKLGDWTMFGEYMGTTLVNNTISNISNSPKSWIVQVTNGVGRKAYFDIARQVNEQKVGDDAWILYYKSSDAGAIPNGLRNLDPTVHAYGNEPWMGKYCDNVKSWLIAYQNVLAKNTVLSLHYQDFRIKNLGLTNLTNHQLNKCYRAQIEFLF